MPVRGRPDNLFLGCGLPAAAAGVPDLQAPIRTAKSDRFDFVSFPLAAPGGQGVGVDFQPSVDSALALDAETWATSVVGAVSEDVDPDAATGGPDEVETRRASLETELRWASHLGLRGVLLPTPATRGTGYARAVNEMLLEGLFAESSSEETPPPLALRVPAGNAGWLAWNRFRTLCDHHPRLAVALELEANLGVSDRALERWLGEPVRYVILHSSVFLKNPSGFPVLPKKFKVLLQGLFRRKIQVIIAAPKEPSPDAAGAAAAPTSAPTEGGAAAATNGAGHDAADAAPAGAGEVPAAQTGARETHSQRLLVDYVARLFEGMPALTSSELFCTSHYDVLQAPLQPLQDNLESETYEIFEKDPVKYAQYEEAVLAFLRDKLNAGRTAPFTVMVLGAGRGPLVAASLRAARRAEADVKVYAVEKNPNAVHALRHRKRREPEWSSVEIVASDMRAWKAPRKADALVSELLGSFGDNELSPECLDGAQHLIADDGVCIPQSYVSSLTPVCAPALWADTRGSGRGGMPGGDDGSLETAYVVGIHRAFYPAADVKDCFTFEHPKKDPAATNDRTADLSFEAEADTLVHGFAGYFDCALYKDVRISIKPETFSTGMFSWFPMFFPLQTPVFVKKGETIRSHWWRRHDARKVWYEWCVSEPTPVAVHNPGGRSWPIGLR